MEGRRQALERVRERAVGLIETGLDNSVCDVFRRIRTDLTAELATFDAELERMFTAYLDAAEVPWGADERDGRRLVHIGASARLPAVLAEGRRAHGAVNSRSDARNRRCGDPSAPGRGAMAAAAARVAPGSGRAGRPRGLGSMLVACYCSRSPYFSRRLVSMKLAS